ncbi:MAG: M43 family zinc metalloprotease [Algibacter sp.]|uniref:M43 family zinc metalloprotease n=1 Tax=Algibacter sp. TaxID=1872428 RepID=UPI00262980B9|nr:M43 family zinc metalloprotease [Algibacter sp.]MDG1730324.1 M43 family zinc metalloprotease [Algibacter sp.]MDG2178902.1 M43 family zinc metalloprotease [Algibacter sp.]
MKNNYFLLLFFLIILSCYNVSGQKITSKDKNLKNITTGNSGFCGADLLHKEKIKADAKYRSRYTQTIQSIKKNSSKKSKVEDVIYKVPVVVHVMHKGEPAGYGSNISDENVKRGIENLNSYWRKIANTLGDGSGVDMKIEFVLAVQDENGQCTNGINHVDMSSVPAYVSNGVNRNENGGISDYDPSNGINSLKEYSVWDTTKYYNVWIVDEIDNKNCYSGEEYFKGYAYYAFLHGEVYDGTVILACDYSDESSTTLAHEMGHAFNLQHTFNYDEDGCGDDSIADTPSHIRPSSLTNPFCDNNEVNDCDPTFNQVINPDTGFVRNSGTHQDHMYNYMNYTDCASEFTGGQRAVSITALIEERTSFLSSPALTPPAKADVSFTASVTYAVVGETITFEDQSSCTPNTYTNTGYGNVSFLWTFNNGVDAPITLTDQNPEVTFNKLGTYDVTLQITNPEGTSSLTKTEHVSVGTAMVDTDPTCTISSIYNNANFGVGVTNLSFYTLNNATDTFIPANSLNDF